MKIWKNSGSLFTEFFRYNGSQEVWMHIPFGLSASIFFSIENNAENFCQNIFIY